MHDPVTGVWVHGDWGVIIEMGEVVTVDSCVVGEELREFQRAGAGEAHVLAPGWGFRLLRRVLMRVSRVEEGG